MKRLLLVVVLALAAAGLWAVEVPVSVVMDATAPYQFELRTRIEEAVAALEGVSLVEAGEGEWFRVQARVLEMKLDSGLSVGYAMSYLILEVPFYLHASILESLPAEKKNQTLERLLRATVFYNGSDLLTVSRDGFPWAARRVASSLEEVVRKRIRTQEAP